MNNLLWKLLLISTLQSLNFFDSINNIGRARGYHLKHDSVRFKKAVDYADDIVRPDFELLRCHNKPQNDPAEFKEALLQQNVHVRPRYDTDSEKIVVAFNLFENTPEKTPIDTEQFKIKERNMLFIPAFTFFDKNFTVYYEAKNLKGKRVKMSKDMCYIYFKDISVKSVITPGGKSRTVPPNENLELQGNKSFDYYRVWYPTKPSREISYLWKCNPITTGKFCDEPNKIVGKEDKLTIPKNLLITGDKFNITLVVSVKNKNGGQVPGKNETQTIIIDKPKVNLTIECELNCPPASSTSNPNETTILIVKCQAECEDIKSEDYQWTITLPSNSTFNFDYKKNTRGRIGQKFVINPNALPPNNYKIKVQLLGKANKIGNKSTSLDFVPSTTLPTSTLPTPSRSSSTAPIPTRPPAIKSNDTCSIEPPEGESVVTRFEFKCKQNVGVYFEMYANDEMIISGTPPEIFTQQFPLPESANRKFRIKVYGKNKGSDYIPISVKVFTPFKTKSDNFIMKNLEDLHSENMKNYANKNHTKSQFSLIKTQVMLDEMKDRKLKDNNAESWTDNLIEKIAKDLLEAIITTIHDVQHITTIITKLTPSKTIPDVAKVISDLCKQVSLKYLELIEAQNDATEHYEDSAAITKTLTTCSRCLSITNAGVLKEIKLNVSTEAPTVTDATITEDYPDYEIYDEKVYEEIEKMKNSTRSIITTAMASAKTMAMTMNKSDVLANVTGDSMSLTVYKGTGEDLLTRIMDGYGFEISLPQDFDGDKHLYDFLISSFHDDIYWWNRAHTRVSTSILNGQIWHTNCKKRLMTFKKPFGVYFNRIKGYHFDETLHNITVEVPKNISKLKEGQLNPFIKVIKVSLANRTKLRVKFYDLPKTGQFDVVITKFKYPTYEDFINKIDVRQNEAREISFMHHENYDVWCYLGILSSQNVQIQVSFIMAFCIQWRASTVSWEHACDVAHYSAAEHVLHCRCFSITSLAGYLQNLQPVSQQLETLTITLQTEIYWIVFLTFTITLFLYVLIILLILFGKRSNYYFLPDNSPADRFAYLLLVRTRSRRNAGTTSQIAVSISGASSKSRSHVLNYPDPKLRLLQTGTEDVFVLTTRRHLGNIKHMKIWFNCEGYSPSWYCEDILLYDMQTQSYWVFDVSTNFSLTQDGKSMVQMKPLSPKEFLTRKKWYSKIKLCDENHTCVCTRSGSNFDISKRSTVILSDILLTFVLVLFMMDALSLKMNYSLDSYCSYYIDLNEILIAIVVSLIVFSVHITLSWMFRSSRLQYSYMQDEVPVSFTGTVVCWIILIIIITFSLTILIIYGFWVPVITACVWLTICAIAIVLQFVVYENLLVGLRRIFVPDRKIVYFEKIYSSIVEVIEAQRSWLYDNFRNLKLLRPHLQQIYIPLDAKKEKAKEELAKKRETIMNQVEDLAMFSIYVIILYAVVIMNKYADTAISRSEIHDMMNGKLTRTTPFLTIQNVHGIYHYINDTLITVLLSSRWYGNYTGNDPGLLVDFSHKIIGIARLRQNRVKKGVCDVPKVMQFLQKNCEPEVDGGFIDKNSYSYGWSKYDKRYENDRLYSIWSYSSENLTEALPIQGEFALYSGGGYMSFLGRTLYNTCVNMKMMFEHYWIGEETRNVFIEFLAYSPNTNVFNSVRLIFEQSASGYVTNDILINSARMLLVSEEIELTIMVLSLCFVVWVFVLLIKQSYGLVKRFRTFYKDIWFWIDFMIVFMSAICIGLMILRMRKVKNYLNRIETSKHNEFVSYFSMFYLEDLLSIFAAFLICIATIRLWKFLRFVMMFRIFERTLFISVPGFSALLAVFVVLGAAFASSGYILYGFYEKKFYSASDVLKTITLLTFSPDKLEDFIEYPSAPIYFTVNVIVNLIFVNIFIATLIMNYAKAQLQIKAQEAAYNVVSYLKEQARYLPKLMRAKLIRLRGGYAEEDIKSSIQPKVDELRYSKSIQNKRLKSMACLTKCLIRNSRKNSQSQSGLSQSDIELMLDVSRIAVHPKTEDSTYATFYQAHFVNSKRTLVAEHRLDLMSKLVEGMLSDKSDRGRPNRRSSGKLSIPLRFLKKSQKMIKKCAIALSLIYYRFNEVEAELYMNE